MSAVLSIPRDRRRASVPVRFVLPWLLAIAGCFSMVFGVGYVPAQDTSGVAAITADAGIAQVPRLAESGAASSTPSQPRPVRADARPAGSPTLKSLALLAFVAALAASVLGNYRGYALNGD